MPNAAQVLSTVGLVLSALGVVILYYWQPPGSVPVTLKVGSTVYLKTGRPIDAHLSKWGFASALLGTAAQCAAVWV